MEILNKLSELVTKVITASGSGTSFYLKDKNIWISNYHVVSGYKQVALENHKKDRFLADVVYVNPVADVAILKSNYTPTGDLTLTRDKTVNTSNQVFVLGFPYGMPYTVTQGIVSSPKQIMNNRYYIQIDAAVNPGNSGGPVVMTDGSLVGITTSKFKEADNMGFAIPTATLEEEIKVFDQHYSQGFSLKCNSCDSLIYTKAEYCNNCGEKIDTTIFDELPLTNVGSFVEDALKQINVNPVLARAGNEFWEFHSGSALIRIFRFGNDYEYLYANATINKLPKTNLDGLLRYLLSDPIPPYKLGVYNNEINIAYRFRLTDMNSKYADSIKRNLTGLATKADEMDDFFVKNFNCEKSVLAKEA